MNETPVPRLDLAPKRKKPLSLWNPLDYLVLLYWVFFFPQALRWYVERFGKPEYQESKGGKAFWKALRHDPVQRRLIIQSLVFLLGITASIVLERSALDPQTKWEDVAGSLEFVMALVVAVGVAVGVAKGVASSVAVVVAGGAVTGMFGVKNIVARGVPMIVMYVVAVGVVGGVLLGIAFGKAVGVAKGVETGMVVGVLFGIAFGMVASEEKSVLLGIAAGMAFGVAFGVAFGRLLDWLLMFPLFLLSKGHWQYLWNRIIWLPLPFVQSRLEDYLERDWPTGVHNLNQVLAYTFQFIPAVAAANSILARLPEDQVLSRIAILAKQSFDWELLLFCSANLTHQFRQEVIKAFCTFFLIPKKWRQRWMNRYPIDLRLDTPAHSACAGFWLWHEDKTEQAVKAFVVTRLLRHGEELYGIARAIVAGKRATTLSELTDWQEQAAWLNMLPDPELRPGALQMLRILRNVANEAKVAYRSQAPLNRSTAFGRAGAGLKRLLDTGADFCPEPEWSLLKDVARRWLDIVIEAGGEVGEEVLRQPVLNPYEGYSGLPVVGPTFVGRRDAIRQIETRWAVADSLPALILYGHRRMGKTSILRNLEHVLPANSLLVYLDMQDAGWVNHTGELLLDLAEAIYKKTAAAGLNPESPPASVDYADLGKARRALNALLARLEPQMTGRRLILAVDEFELIEDGIKKGRIDSGLLPYLRALNQRHAWLALIFGGLHTLDEMGRDYKNAFYGQTQHIRVGYLSHDGALRLITQPHPDFALEYASELREELYRLTYGQPYLLQRLCWELVNRWNERFMKEGETTPRTLELTELEPVLTADFYRSVEYYFDGVWSNITDNEQAVMKILAQRETAWTRQELTAIGAVANIDQTLELLRRHDVIVEDDAGIRFASELLRRWVAGQMRRH